MSDTVLLKKIGKLIDTKLKPVKKQLNTVAVKLETVEMKVEIVNKRVEQTGQQLENSIAKSQEETIEALSNLIHAGHDIHEKRIRKMENHLQLP